MTDYKGLSITFEGDTTALSEVLHKISDSAKQAQGNLTGIQNALKFDTKNPALYAAQVKETGKRLQAAKDRQEAFAQAIEKTKQKISSYQSALSQMRSAGMTDTAEYQNYLRLLADEEANLEYLQDEYIKVGGTIEEWTRKHQSAIAQEAIHTTALGKFGSAAVEAGQGITTLGDGLQTLGDRLSVISIERLRSVLRGVISDAEEFGNVISQVGGYLDIEGSELNEMSDLALYWGKETRYSAVEAGQAMSTLAKGGLSEAQIKSGALAASMELAAAGNISMSQAADVTVQAMKTLGLQAEDATSIADALAGAANKSTAEITDLSQGFVQVGGWAKLAGWDIHDTAGALALMADHGYTGAMAGTALKVMLQRLAAPTDAAKEKLDALGINVRNADGSMKSATEVVDAFNQATANLSDEERDAALNTIFGTRAINAMLALMQDGSATLQNYIDATEEQGYAAEMAQAQLGELGWALEYLRGEAETASVNVGNVLTPMIIDLAKTAEGVLQVFNESDDATQEWIVEMGLAVVATGPFLKILGRMVSGFGGFVTSVGRGAEFLSGFIALAGTGGSKIEAFGVALEVASDGAITAEAGIKAVSAAIKGIGITVGVTALVAAFAYLVQTNQEYQASLEIIPDGQKKVTKSSESLAEAVERATKGTSELNDEISNLDEAYDAADALDRLAQANESLESSISRNNESYLAERDRLTEAREAIEKYAGETGLMTDQQKELQKAVDTINQLLGTNYELTDAANGKIQEQGTDAEVTKDQLQELIDKELEYARTQAILSSMQSAYETYYSTLGEVDQASTALSKSQTKLNTAQQRYNELIEKNKNQGWLSWADSIELASLETDIRDYTNEVNASQAALDAATDSAKSQADAIDELSDAYSNAAEGGMSELENALAMMGESTRTKFLGALEELGIGVEEFSGLTKQQTLDLLNFVVGQWSGDKDTLLAFIDELNGKELEDKESELKGDARDILDKVADATQGVYSVPKTWGTTFTGDTSLLSLAVTRAKNLITAVAQRVGTTITAGAAAGGIRTHADGGIRYHAGGSIVNVPKYGYPLNLVGEAGAEAIVPLTNRRYSQPFIDMIADAVGNRVGGTTNNLYIDGARINDDPAIQAKFLDLMYDLNRRAEMQRG